MRNTDWLFIFHQAPAQNSLAQEALDFMLVAAAFGVNIQLLFVGESIKHIMRTTSFQQTETLPSYVKTFGALADFEISNVAVLDTSLSNSTDKNEPEFRVNVEVINSKKMRKLLSSAHKVFNF